MSLPGVMQMVDRLDAGGLESVAVNLANLVPVSRFASHICATRGGGTLLGSVKPDVSTLVLDRRGRIGLGALPRILRYIDRNDVRVIHAHGTSVCFGALCAAVASRCGLIWHVHSGKLAVIDRVPLSYRLAERRAAAVITVNEPLLGWVRQKLNRSDSRSWYIPNFVLKPEPGPAPLLPGERGLRIACVANLRPEKDHPNLIRAMRLVVDSAPNAHLILAGAAPDEEYRDRLLGMVKETGLAANVTWLGARPDVGEILRNCDIGVLASESEGLPMALLEYGAMGLAVAATAAGQCEEVLDGGTCGLIVPPRNAGALARSLITLLDSTELRAELGSRLARRIDARYSAESVTNQIWDIYDRVLG